MNLLVVVILVVSLLFSSVNVGDEALDMVRNREKVRSGGGEEQIEERDQWARKDELS